MVLLSSLLVLSSLSVPVVYLLERKSEKAAVITLVAVLAFDLCILMSFVPTVLSKTAYRESYYWIPMLGSIFTLYIDGVSLSLSAITLVLTLMATIYSIGYMEREKPLFGYYAFIGMLTVGLVGVFITSCLLAFYFFWELMLIPTYFIIANWGYREPQSVAFKFFIFTHAGAVFVLLGIGAVYMMTNTLDIFEAQRLLAKASPDLVKWILIFFTGGFAVKMAIVPLHMWLPDAHSEAPAPMSALLSGVIIEAGGYAIFRISLQTIYPLIHGLDVGSQFIHALSVLGVISAFYGSLTALAQHDIKRVVAYSSISHMGYTLFGLSLFPSSMTGVTGAILHLVNHAASKGLFFLTAGSVMRGTGTRNIDEMGGLASSMPFTAVSSAIAAFSIAGTPAFAIFMSEFFMLTGGFQASAVDSFYYAPSILMVISTVLSAAYSLRLFWKVFLGEHKLKEVKEAPWSMIVPMMALASLVVILGVYPRLFLDLIAEAV